MARDVELRQIHLQAKLTERSAAGLRSTFAYWFYIEDMIHLFIYLFIHVFIIYYLFIYLFIYLLIYLFIYFSRTSRKRTPSRPEKGSWRCPLMGG